jgi:hypothetical protein
VREIRARTTQNTRIRRPPRRNGLSGKASNVIGGFVKRIGSYLAAVALITAACSSSNGNGTTADVSAPTTPSQVQSPTQGNVRVSRARVFMKDGRVQALIQGELGDGCTSLEPIQQRRSANTVDITVRSRRQGEVCTMIMQFVNEWVPLDGEFTPGEYTLRANAAVTTFTLVRDANGDLQIDPDPGPPPTH